MLACGHESPPFGAPMCIHLRSCREPWISYIKWYTGADMYSEFLCNSCSKDREKGISVEVKPICQTCFENAISEYLDLEGNRGKPGIRVRHETINCVLRDVALPENIGKIVDIAPVNCESESIWFLLSENGDITRFNADTREWAHTASSDVPLEPDHKQWGGHDLKRKLHVSSDGKFAAVVNDYGRHGQLVDLKSGKITLNLEGDNYHSNTVPFSFAFVDVRGRTVAIHRTSWNRLDVTDPSSGKLLTERGPTKYVHADARPEHYLDFFHGALYASPSGTYIVDDGWVWHPVGVLAFWNIEKWISENVWESEDGPTKKHLCARDYHWGDAVVWINESIVAIGGLGDDDIDIVSGARIFNIALESNVGDRYRGNRAREVNEFAGPAGFFFSDGVSLFSSDENGLSRWDITDGSRTGQVPSFRPTHHHRGAREFVQLDNLTLRRWSVEQVRTFV
jgi:hypothetical protein